MAGRLLLAVFLPMLFVASVHIHPVQTSAADECTECISHKPHAGHLAAATTPVHDCVLCNFLSLPYLAVAIVTVVLYHRARKYSLAMFPAVVYITERRTVGLRAPPAAANKYCTSCQATAKGLTL